MMRLLFFFEQLLDPTSRVPTAPPGRGFVAFSWHYVGQVRALIAALFVAGFAVAALESGGMSR